MHYAEDFEQRRALAFEVELLRIKLMKECEADGKKVFQEVSEEINKLPPPEWIRRSWKQLP